MAEIVHVLEHQLWTVIQDVDARLARAKKVFYHGKAWSAELHANEISHVVDGHNWPFWDISSS